MAATGCIWIVDDDHAIRWVLARALRATTLRPVLFETGEAALRAAEQGLPDAVITDVRMPGIDGWRLMAQLQRFGQPGRQRIRRQEPGMCLSASGSLGQRSRRGRRRIISPAGSRRL